MSGGLTLAITGAAGFVGRHTVAAARARGHAVRAVVRSAASAPPEWRSDAMISVLPLDLSADDAGTALAAALDGVDAVIHAAAAFTGDDLSHARDTLKPTATLLAAMAEQPTPPWLVLVSSLAVYDTRLLAEGAVLDESVPLEPDPHGRDAYCRSKLAQEAQAIEAAGRRGLEVRIMRPGAIFGAGRLWNAHLGQAFGPAVVQLETRGQVPVSFVGHCADALVLAAECPMVTDDRTGPHSGGRVEIINVLDDDLPDRARYMQALRRSGWPRYVVRGSWRPLAGIAVLLSALGKIAPTAQRRIPGLLRPAVIAARMKPIAYSNHRLRERLGWRPRFSFEEAMRQSCAGGEGEAVDARSH